MGRVLEGVGVGEVLGVMEVGFVAGGVVGDVVV